MDQVEREAERRKIELVVLPTAEAIELLKNQPAVTNAILHVSPVEPGTTPNTNIAKRHTSRRIASIVQRFRSPPATGRN
jgi:hypothetical protein